MHYTIARLVIALFSRYRSIELVKLHLTRVRKYGVVSREGTKGIFRVSLDLVQNNSKLCAVKQVFQQTCC